MGLLASPESDSWQAGVAQFVSVKFVIV